MHPKYSSSKENYLKAIFHLQELKGTVTTNDVANEMQTRPASVTDMLKKLKAQKLLLYEKYQGFKLSTEGRKVALQIIRKHRLWEYFLVEKLQFGWDEVHEIAEELEHIGSKKLTDAPPSTQSISTSLRPSISRSPIDCNERIVIASAIVISAAPAHAPLQSPRHNAPACA